MSSCFLQKGRTRSYNFEDVRRAPCECALSACFQLASTYNAGRYVHYVVRCWAPGEVRGIHKWRVHRVQSSLTNCPTQQLVKFDPPPAFLCLGALRINTTRVGQSVSTAVACCPFSAVYGCSRTSTIIDNRLDNITKHLAQIRSRRCHAPGTALHRCCITNLPRLFAVSDSAL